MVHGRKQVKFFVRHHPYVYLSVGDGWEKAYMQCVVQSFNDCLLLPLIGAKRV